MKIEKGSGADKFWAGILSVPLILEILMIVKFFNSINYQQLISNYYIGDVISWYLGLVLLSILWLSILMSSTLLDEYFLSDSLYYRITLGIILSLPSLIILFPAAIVVLFFILLGKGIFFMYLLIKDYPSEFLNYINNWANERF